MTWRGLVYVAFVIDVFSRRTVRWRAHTSMKRTSWSTPTVGSTGDISGNALAESVIGLYMAEVIHRRRPWRGFDDVGYVTLESARHDGPDTRFRRRTAWVIHSDS